VERFKEDIIGSKVEDLAILSEWPLRELASYQQRVRPVGGSAVPCFARIMERVTKAQVYFGRLKSVFIDFFQ